MQIVNKNKNSCNVSVSPIIWIAKIAFLINCEELVIMYGGDLVLFMYFITLLRNLSSLKDTITKHKV